MKPCFLKSRMIYHKPYKVPESVIQAFRKLAKERERRIAEIRAESLDYDLYDFGENWVSKHDPWIKLAFK